MQPPKNGTKSFFFFVFALKIPLIILKSQIAIDVQQFRLGVGASGHKRMGNKREAVFFCLLVFSKKEKKGNGRIQKSGG